MDNNFGIALILVLEMEAVVGMSVVIAVLEKNWFDIVVSIDLVVLFDFN